MGAAESTQDQDQLQEQGNGLAQLQARPMPQQLPQDVMTPVLSSPTPQPQTRAAIPARQRLSLPNSRPPAGPFPGGSGKLGADFDDDDQLDDVATSSWFGGWFGTDAQPEPEAKPEPKADSAEVATLSVKTRVEFSAVPRGTRQDVFGLVTVTAVEVPDAPEPDGGAKKMGEQEPMDIVCVLDVSGSMGGEKIRLLQDAVRFVIEQAHEKDRVSIVTFNSQAARHLRLRRMLPEGKSEAITATLRLVAGGGTSIAAGLDAGVAVMERRRSRNKVSAILLLTDGQDSGSRTRIPELLSRCRDAKCSLYAFGFGKDHDAAMLSSIAEQAMTPFTFVEDVDHIREAFAGTVGGLSSVVAQGIELSLDCHVALKAVHTPFVVQRTSEKSATVLIPDIFGGESRDILVELDVPMASLTEEDTGASSSWWQAMTTTLSGGGPAQQSATEQEEEVPAATLAPSGMVLLEAHVKYTDLKRNVVVETPPVTMSTERLDEPQPELEPDEEVSAQRERVEVTRALRQAAEQSDRLDFDGARQVLDSQASALKSKKKATRMSPALLLELQDASSRMASRSSWEKGGRAEVNDSVQMHSMQRCTNISHSSASSVQKCSKKMYISSKARKKISKLDGSDSD